MPAEHNGLQTMPGNAPVPKSRDNKGAQHKNYTAGEVEQPGCYQKNNRQITPPISSSPAVERKIHDNIPGIDSSPTSSAEASMHKCDKFQPTPPKSSPLSRKRKPSVKVFTEDTNFSDDDYEDDFPAGQSNTMCRFKSSELSKRTRHMSVPATFHNRLILGNVSANVVPLNLPPQALQQIRQAVGEELEQKLQQHKNSAPLAITQMQQQQALPQTTQCTSSRSTRRAIWNRNHPQLPDNVPEDEKWSDMELIEVGKEKNGYRRHELARYTFSRRGRLYDQYKHLINFQNEDGTSAWSDAVVARILTA